MIILMRNLVRTLFEIKKKKDVCKTVSIKQGPHTTHRGTIIF